MKITDLGNDPNFIDFIDFLIEHCDITKNEELKINTNINGDFNGTQN